MKVNFRSEEEVKQARERLVNLLNSTSPLDGRYGLLSAMSVALQWVSQDAQGRDTLQDIIDGQPIPGITEPSPPK